MYKSLLKLATAGVMITALLAVAMITQGCSNRNTAPTQDSTTAASSLELPTGQETNDTSTLPSSTEATTKPTEPAATEKPTIGQIVQDFINDLFGGEKDESIPTETTNRFTEETTSPSMSIETMDYKTFRTLTSAEKMAFRSLFVDSSGNVDDEAFVDWYTQAKKAYDDQLEADSATGPFGFE